MKIKSIRTACIILCTTIIVACSIGVNLVTYTGMKGTIKRTNSKHHILKQGEKRYGNQDECTAAGSYNH